MTTANLQQGTSTTTVPLEFDEDGFLKEPGTWTKETARLIADLDGLGPLGPDHWALIFYLRERHMKYGSLPVMAHACRVNHLKKDAVRTLFGGCKPLWRIAGLPNPGEEAKAYM